MVVYNYSQTTRDFSPGEVITCPKCGGFVVEEVVRLEDEKRLDIVRCVMCGLHGDREKGWWSRSASAEVA